MMLLHLMPPALIKKSKNAPKPRIIWKDKNFHLADDQKAFKGIDVLPNEITDLETPYQFFKYFFQGELFQKIVEESMLYKSHTNPNDTLLINKETVQKYWYLYFDFSFLQHKCT